MSGSGARGADVGTLALRLAACLFLTGAAIFAVIAVVVTRFATAVVEGSTRYVVPGSSGTVMLDPSIQIVLASCACGMGAIGLVVLVLAGRPRQSATQPTQPSAPRPSRSARPYLVLGAGLLVLLLAVALRRHSF